MDGFNRAMYMLPPEIRQGAETFREAAPEEFRLRQGRRPTALIGGKEYELNCSEVIAQDIGKILEKITGASLHTAAPAMSEGFISFMGLRVGICGEAIIHNKELKGFKNFSSLAIRIPKECKGICDDLMDEMYFKGFRNTLLISRPGGGKTTALREIIRRLSNSGYRIGVLDERNELGASEGGVPQFDLGSHTDLISFIPKVAGAMMLLKGMNEEIIAMDEISSAGDISALSQICGCGVGVLASAHAKSKDELYMRPLYRRLLELEVFQYIVTISGSGTKRKYIAERI